MSEPHFARIGLIGGLGVAPGKRTAGGISEGDCNSAYRKKMYLIRAAITRTRSTSNTALASPIPQPIPFIISIIAGTGFGLLDIVGAVLTRYF